MNGEVATKPRLNQEIKINNSLCPDCLSRCWYGLRSHGETQDEHGATLGPVVAGALALMILHHSIGGAQAQPSAFANGFSCVEGIKDALRLADSGAGVGKLQHHLIAFAPRARQEGSAAHFVQSIHGIAYDFQAALKELVGVAPDPRKAGRNAALDSNFLAFQTEQFHLYGALQY